MSHHVKIEPISLTVDVNVHGDAPPIEGKASQTTKTTGAPE